MSSDARLAFIHRFRNDVIQSFFFDDRLPDSPRLNITNGEMDRSLKLFREKLVKHLDDYIKKIYPHFFESYNVRDISNKLAYFEDMLNAGSFSVNELELLKIPVMDALTDDVLKTKLFAYTSYIAIKHFDDLLSSAFGNSIKNLYKDNYNTDKLKYKINLGNNNSTSWRDESKDVDET